MLVPSVKEPRVRSMTPRVALVIIATGMSLALVAFVLRAAWVDGFSFLTWAKAAIAYPFELDYGEGPILSQTTRLMHGLSIYRPATEAPYNIGNYPPVYHFVVAAVARLHGPLLSAGRLVSASSTVLIALLIALASAWSPSRAGTGLAVPRLAIRAAVGLTAGLLFLATKPVYFWGAFMRVDMLAILFSVAGVCTYLIWQGKGWSAYASVVLFLLAAFTKQSTIAGAVAVLITAAVFQPRKALEMGFIGLVGGATVFAVVNVLTGGQFYFHLVTANANAFRWGTVRWMFTDVFNLHYVLARLAIAGALVSLAVFARRPRGEKPYGRLLLPAYLLFAAVVSLTVGKVGSSFNYLVELMAALSICTGVLVVDVLEMFLDAVERTSSAVRPGLRAIGELALCMVCAVALSVVLVGYSKRLDPPHRGWVPVPNEASLASNEQALGHILRTSGPILSEVMTFMPLAARDIEFQPFELTQLSYQGIWDQGPLLGAIAARKYSLVILTFSIMDDPGWHADRFTPEMIAAIRENYSEIADYGGLKFYAPSW